jgi:hypothetical protein
MADNFNLRQFLTENKLTKNAKLLKEQVSLNGKPVNIGSIEIDGIDRNDHPDYVDAYITYAEYEDGTPLTDEELMSLEDDNYGLTGELIHDRQLYLQEKKEEGLDEADWRNNPYTPHNFDGVAAEANKHKHLMKIANELFPQYGGNLENFKPLSPLEIKQVYRQYTDDTKVIPFKESKLTAKERRLVEMVENALGLTNNDEDQEFDPGHDIEQAQHNKERQYEGEEMVQEKPLPKYENIEKLMQEIEHGTNEAAYKHKMAKMKEVAEMLEARVGSLEEGEGAEFVDTKKVKQMKKDIMTLRKQAEKLEKEYDKKFGEKKARRETQTENKMKDFNLRKFLTENKLTTNSRMLSEVAGLEQYRAGTKLQRKGKPDETFTVQLVEPGTTKGMEAAMALHLKDDNTGKEFRDSPGDYEIVNEGQVNEAIIDLSDTAVSLLMDKTKYATKPGSNKGVYVVYDLSIPKGKGSFGDDDATQKVGYWWTKDSAYKANKFESDHQETINKLK